MDTPLTLAACSPAALREQRVRLYANALALALLSGPKDDRTRAFSWSLPKPASQPPVDAVMSRLLQLYPVYEALSEAPVMTEGQSKRLISVSRELAELSTSLGVTPVDRRDVIGGTYLLRLPACVIGGQAFDEDTLPVHLAWREWDGEHQVRAWLSTSGDSGKRGEWPLYRPVLRSYKGRVSASLQAAAAPVAVCVRLTQEAERYLNETGELHVAA